MKLLITGASGFSGQEFLKILNNDKLQEYSEVHVVLRNNNIDGFLKKSNLNIIVHNGDLNDFEFVKNITKNMDRILHIAGIQMSKNIFEAAILNNVDWIVAVHTTGRYSKFKSASAEYIEIEENLLKSKDKINMTILRPTMIYGSMKDRNMSKLVKYLDKVHVYPVFGSGKNLMQPVNGKDLAIAYYNVLKIPTVTKNKEYNLSGQEAIEYLDLLRTVSKKLGKSTTFVRIPIKLSYYSAKIATKVIPKFPIHEEQVLRMQEDKAFNHEDARKDFGFTPRSFEIGIEEQIREYKDEKN